MNHHLSEDQMCRAIAGQSTIDELRHVAECAACRAELDRSRSMLAAFRAAVTGLAERDARRSTKGFAAGPRARRVWSPAVAAAALVAVLPLLVWQIRGVNPSPPAGRSEPRAAVPSDVTEFFPLAYSNVPVTGGHIVRLEVPRSALAAFGIEAIDSVTARPDAVLADIVVGEDGLARAVRFVHPRME